MKTLFISFDALKEDKYEKSYTSLVIEKTFTERGIGFFNKSINVCETESKINSYGTSQFSHEKFYDIEEEILGLLNTDEYTNILISHYSWSEQYTKYAIDIVKSVQPNSIIILGGYSVNTKTINALLDEYNDVDCFFIGGNTEILVSELLMKNKLPRVINTDENSLPKKYYRNIYSNLNIEGKTISTYIGIDCPNKCNYCDYSREKFKGMSHYKTINLDTVILDIRDSIDKGVKKINLIDPIFSIAIHLGGGIEFFKTLCKILEDNGNVTISVQESFKTFKQNIIRTNLIEFIPKNMEFEFGLQSYSNLVYNKNGISNSCQIVDEVVTYLKKYNINYYFSVIIGLPGETVESFTELIDYIKYGSHSERVSFYKLTLFKNTKTYSDMEELEIEYEFDNNNLKVIKSSYSFTKEELKVMELLSKVF